MAKLQGMDPTRIEKSQNQKIAYRTTKTSWKGAHHIEPKIPRDRETDHIRRARLPSLRDKLKEHSEHYNFPAPDPLDSKGGAHDQQRNPKWIIEAWDITASTTCKPETGDPKDLLSHA